MTIAPVKTTKAASNVHGSKPKNTRILFSEGAQFKRMRLSHKLNSKFDVKKQFESWKRKENAADQT